MGFLSAPLRCSSACSFYPFNSRRQDPSSQVIRGILILKNVSHFFFLSSFFFFTVKFQSRDVVCYVVLSIQPYWKGSRIHHYIFCATPRMDCSRLSMEFYVPFLFCWIHPDNIISRWLKCDFEPWNLPFVSLHVCSLWWDILSSRLKIFYIMDNGNVLANKSSLLKDFLFNLGELLKNEK